MNESMFSGSMVSSNRILYTPSSFAKTNLIHVQEIGRLTALRPHTSRRKNMASYLFFLVLDGSGTVQYGGEEYLLQAGDCVFLDCQKPYSHRSSDQLWSLQWVHFYGSNMGGIYEKYLQRGGTPCFTSRHPEDYSALLQEIFDIAASDLYIRDMKLYEKLTALLTYLMEESWNPGQPAAESPRTAKELQSIKNYLDLHYTEKISLDQLAEQFYINKFYLTRIFKQQYGISIQTYLQQLRITYAKQLLRFTSLSVEEIGQRCGVPDGNYFSRMFKKIEGMTPREFRQMWTK